MMALFKSYDKYIIVDGSMKKYMVCGSQEGLVFSIRYPSYRGTFLSCIEELNFFIDEQEVNQENITLMLHGKQFTINQLDDCYKEYWETLECMQVLFLGNYTRNDYSIKVHMKHRIPYTGYNGKCLVMTSECEKQISAN